MFAAWVPVAGAQDTTVFPGELAGETFEYAAQPGDTLTRIGARFGVQQIVLARTNDIKRDAMLRPGQLLQVDNRHIVPERLEDGILINLPQRMLYFFRAGKLEIHYPVGLGRPDWPTPTGRFRIVDHQENKPWQVPQSIQEEMRREGKIVQTKVPPGPDNPLGKHWLGLSIPGIGIHGTIAPASVYHFQSHGCIRSHPDDIAKLFERVDKGEPGKIIYSPVLLARLGDGRIFLEIHPDIYKKGIKPLTLVARLARAQGIANMLNWNGVKNVIRLKEGLAREVGLPVPVLNGGAE